MLEKRRGVLSTADDAQNEGRRVFSTQACFSHGDVELLQDLGLVQSAANKQGKPTRLTSDTTEIVFKIAV